MFFNWTPPLYEHLVSVSVCSCIKNCAFLTPLLLYIFVVPLVHFSVPFYFQVGTTKICTCVCGCLSVCPSHIRILFVSFVCPTPSVCAFLFVPPLIFVFCSAWPSLPAQLKSWPKLNTKIGLHTHPTPPTPPQTF